MKNNKLLLLPCLTTLSLCAMNSGMTLDIYGMNIKQLSAVRLEDLHESKKRCLELNVDWPENITHVVEIKPQFYGENGKVVYCLSHNPRELNRAIITSKKINDTALLMKQLMTPQIPKFIPCTQELLENFDELKKFQTFLGGYSLTINFEWSQRSAYGIQKERSKAIGSLSVDKHTGINPCMIATAFGWGLAAVLYLYMG